MIVPQDQNGNGERQLGTEITLGHGKGTDNSDLRLAMRLCKSGNYS